MCPGWILFVFILLGVSSSSSMYRLLFFTKFRDYLPIVSSRLFFLRCFFVFLFFYLYAVFFLGCHIYRLLVYSPISYLGSIYLNPFVFFPLCSSVSTFIYLYSKLLTLSSSNSNLLLCLPMSCFCFFKLKFQNSQLVLFLMTGSH